jgi:Spy/CpxP family protein refolding chaperone
MRKRITLLVMAVVLALTMSLGGAAAAFAKIEPVTRNPQGHETQGQGKAQTTTNENPAGHAPPGQN